MLGILVRALWNLDGFSSKLIRLKAACKQGNNVVVVMVIQVDLGTGNVVI